MPYAWTESPSATRLRLWPHQSLTARGFSWFISVTAAMLALPLLAVLGSPVVWVLLAFFLVALAGVWHAIVRNQRHRSMHEALTLTDQEVRITHVPSAGPERVWRANPYWVNLRLRNDGPVEKYLTLSGGGREVELGRFLTPDERAALFVELGERLRA